MLLPKSPTNYQAITGHVYEDLSPLSDNMTINTSKRIRTSSKRYLNVNLDNSLATINLPCIMKAEKKSVKSVDIGGCLRHV